MTSFAGEAHAAPAAIDDRSWSSVVRRDAAADGLFWYSVATTGVYCRPSCPSRVARRENVRRHESIGAARQSGFRPCRRCDPDGNPDATANRADQVALVAKACRAIEAADDPPSLAHLAGTVGLSRFHFHRLFRSITGLTPKAYADGCRSARLREALAEQPSVTAAIYAAGFNANSRFYESAAGMLGMRPGRYRDGGARETLRFAVGRCSLGDILVASSMAAGSTAGVAAILLGDDPDALVRDLQDRFRNAELVGGDAGYETLVAQVVGLVEAPRLGCDLPLDIRGTAFQQRVWQALRDIPPGTTSSYGEIAIRIGATGGARAVAGACAANPLAVAIPCHRVVRQDGALSGYRWGIDRKRKLLALEGTVPERG